MYHTADIVNMANEKFDHFTLKKELISFNLDENSFFIEN